MSSISETIVREYLEERGFLVRQLRKFVTPNRADDEIVDFLAAKPGRETANGGFDFILDSKDLDSIHRAVVIVKGWHTETFSPAVLEHAPDLDRCLDPDLIQRIDDALGGNRDVAKILVIPGLPKERALREESVELLRGKGIDAALSFHVLLEDLIERVETNRNYAKSDLLQTLRILKNYDFFKEPQLELFHAPKRRKKKN